MTDNDKRFVRTGTDQPVFLQGHGVIQPGQDGTVEVAASEDLDAALEAGVLKEGEAPKPADKPDAGKSRRTTTDKPGGDS